MFTGYELGLLLLKIGCIFFLFQTKNIVSSASRLGLSVAFFFCRCETFLHLKYAMENIYKFVKTACYNKMQN